MERKKEMCNFWIATCRRKYKNGLHDFEGKTKIRD
jgi:hypothetical protein